MKYRDTMNYVRDNLHGQYKVGSIDGTMNIQERNELSSDSEILMVPR
jgi:hypothetical protein